MLNTHVLAQGPLRKHAMSGPLEGEVVKGKEAKLIAERRPLGGLIVAKADTISLPYLTTLRSGPNHNLPDKQQKRPYLS
jgi:hypothetical protein